MPTTRYDAYVLLYFISLLYFILLLDDTADLRQTTGTKRTLCVLIGVIHYSFGPITFSIYNARVWDVT